MFFLSLYFIERISFGFNHIAVRGRGVQYVLFVRKWTSSTFVSHGFDSNENENPYKYRRRNRFSSAQIKFETSITESVGKKGYVFCLRACQRPNHFNPSEASRCLSDFSGFFFFFFDVYRPVRRVVINYGAISGYRIDVRSNQIRTRFSCAERSVRRPYVTKSAFNRCCKSLRATTRAYGGSKDYSSRAKTKASGDEKKKKNIEKGFSRGSSWINFCTRVGRVAANFHLSRRNEIRIEKSSEPLWPTHESFTRYRRRTQTEFTFYLYRRFIVRFTALYTTEVCNKIFISNAYTFSVRSFNIYRRAERIVNSLCSALFRSNVNADQRRFVLLFKRWKSDDEKNSGTKVPLYIYAYFVTATGEGSNIVYGKTNDMLVLV